MPHNAPCTPANLVASNVARAAMTSAMIHTPHFTLLPGHDDVHPVSTGFRRTHAYLTYRQPTEAQQENLIEYDLEEEDIEFLQELNERFASLKKHKKHKKRKKRKKVLSENSLERIIDLLEKESFHQRHEVSLDHALDHLVHIPNWSLENQPSDVTDLPCSVCNAPEWNEENLIVFCDGCDVAVHQQCYGIEVVPPGDEPWLCRRCESRETTVRCCMCPMKGGALKRTKDGRWAHIACALWIPGPYLEDVDTMEPIRGIENVPAEHANKVCCLCQKKVGFCVECTEPGCPHWFHVTCAFRVGLIVSLQPDEQGLLEWSALCWQHSMGHWIDRRQAIWAAQENSPTTWLREMIPSRAHPLARELARCPPAVVETVYNYWLQKRKAKGKPLLRRLQVAAKDEEVVSKRKLFTPRVTQADVEKLRQLRNEMERVRLLTDMSWKRERFKRQLLTIDRDGFETQLAQLLGVEKRKRSKSTKPSKVDRRRAAYRRSIGRNSGKTTAGAASTSSTKSKRSRITSPNAAESNGTLRSASLVTRGKTSEYTSSEALSSLAESNSTPLSANNGVRLSRRLGVRVPLEKHRQMQARDDSNNNSYLLIPADRER